MSASVGSLPQAAEPRLLDALAELVARARRPMLWLGGGAREAGAAALELVERGFAAVTSTNGRAVVPETHPLTLGAYNMTPEAQAIYDRADLMIVVGSRLRGNETRNNTARAAAPAGPDRCRRDPGGAQLRRRSLHQCRCAAGARRPCCERLPEKLDVDDDFCGDVAVGAHAIGGEARGVARPYRAVADALQAHVARGAHPFVRDVTLSNSTFGNRYVHLAAPHLGVHALGGGIGQGIAMAIGAALARHAGEDHRARSATAAPWSISASSRPLVDAKADIVFILMNDRGYGVIRNIQDAQFGGRRHYADLHTPDFALLAAAFGLPHQRVARHR